MDGDVGRIELTGDLDIATATDLRAALAALVDVPLTVVDLGGVLFCGARGMHVLVEAAAHTAARGGRFVVVHCPPAVSTLVRLLHVPWRPWPLAGDVPGEDDDPGMEILPTRTIGVRAASPLG
ncbi:STAS domain-containing protein [Pseudonocardia sp. KRD-184]|uniref:STAS domain-containing protein n=1 Tax=Pseudonocardia oceani TaxID=2792013 RepID=A0ABS6UIU0_9PSEU|nr:STAS domain-containing protein [Pseudonocardia oceani]MBW0092740.1 STAS domain-containing protein [Pseudonocardia oceani]MBW0099543.1 STAS domain-containing protein [Pseudonocardia oceani]MBW0112158.1 STAS domain-containing protein [Pseudonocardia oceani]MBW0123068.1 STAS domain-containing protein [Pseudonocardia oceani]MBW0131831.1 STAS domain-containing protein [Pseudonocardia oceani]